MIAHLTGTLVTKQPPEVVVDVGGVGYQVIVPMTTFYQLPAEGQKVSLLTHMSVREDAHVLYGFLDASSRDLFRLLIRINGVGPKMALAILSAMEPFELMSRIREEDVAGLTKIPGVGKKTAERLMVEMRDKIATDTVPEQGTLSNASNTHASAQLRWEKEALAALVSLGYSPAQASRALSRLDGPFENCEQMIRLALKQLAP